MHSVIPRLAVIVGGVLLFGSQVPAAAGPADDGGAVCNPLAGKCKVSVVTPPRPGHSNPGSGDAGGGNHRPPRCVTVLLRPQPPKSEPVWAGNTTGAIYQKMCDIGGVHPGTTVVWAPAPPAGAAPTVTPAELAQQAVDSLTLPKPVLHRSPPESNLDEEGMPFTWVNLWTWYWTAPSTWRELSKTASLGTVSATVTVTPTRLTFTPGDGTAPVSCAGPGRPWTTADGNEAPSAGGCGYRYRKATEPDLSLPPEKRGIAATLTTTWDVAWTGSGGQGGALPAMTTSLTSPRFEVKQILTVNR